MQHYVATRPMFIDVEIMNTDIQVVLGDDGPEADSSTIEEGLHILYKEIAGIYKLCSDIYCFISSTWMIIL